MKKTKAKKAGLELSMLKAGLALVSLAFIIFSINFVSASTFPCLLQVHNGESISAPGVQSWGHFTCDGLTCTVLGYSTPSGFSQVCVNSSKSYYFGSWNDCASHCDFSSNGSTYNLVLKATFPFANGGVYNKQSFFLNISMNKIGKIYLRNNVLGTQVNLCTNCNSYKQFAYFSKGFNNITIIGQSGAEQKEKTITFIVDNDIPRISKSLPASGKFASGAFTVFYYESAVKEIAIYYGPVGSEIKQNLTDCSSGNYKNCSITVDLSSFEGQMINYWFTIKDLAGNSASGYKISVKVDNIAPVVTSINYVLKTSTSMLLNISVIEPNFYRLEYRDNGGYYKLLCSYLTNGRCVKIIYSLTKGDHVLDIRTTDKAGHVSLNQTSFTIL